MSIFATHAAVAIANSQSSVNLTDAMRSREVIGRAKGILMMRFRISADEAFEMLRRESQSFNIKLREVSETLCTGGRLPSEE